MPNIYSLDKEDKRGDSNNKDNKDNNSSKQLVSNNLLIRVPRGFQYSIDISSNTLILSIKVSSKNTITIVNAILESNLRVDIDITKLAKSSKELRDSNLEHSNTIIKDALFKDTIFKEEDKKEDIDSKEDASKDYSTILTITTTFSTSANLLSNNLIL